jgi:hypothetical protein
MNSAEAIAVLREALLNWANVIDHQYTGSSDAMSFLQHADNIGQQALAATEHVEDGPIPIEYSTDPDGELALDWMVGDMQMSISIGGVGKLSWVTDVGGKTCSGSREFDTRTAAPSVQAQGKEGEKS